MRAGSSGRSGAGSLPRLIFRRVYFPIRSRLVTITSSVTPARNDLPASGRTRAPFRPTSRVSRLKGHVGPRQIVRHPAAYRRPHAEEADACAGPRELPDDPDHREGAEEQRSEDLDGRPSGTDVQSHGPDDRRALQRRDAQRHRVRSGRERVKPRAPNASSKAPEEQCVVRPRSWFHGRGSGRPADSRGCKRPNGLLPAGRMPSHDEHDPRHPGQRQPQGHQRERPDHGLRRQRQGRWQERR